MQENTLCPRCGLLLVNGRCPSCGDQGTTPLVTERRSWNPLSPSSRIIVRVLAAVGGGWLALGFLVFHMIRDAVHHVHAHPTEKSAVQLRDWPHHLGPVAQVSELKGQGTIYLIQMGEHKDAYNIADLARSLGSQYGLDIRVLPPSGLDPSALDPVRHQYIAETLFERLKRDHADLAADRNAYLIGFTDADMYSVTHNWEGTFTERDGERVAVISSEDMGDGDRWRVTTIDGQSASEHLQARMRRILLKDIALLYWHLPFNNDPTSLLYETLNPDKPTDDLYESDLHPEESPWGQSIWDPCLFLTYSAGTGLQPLPGEPIRSCGEWTTVPVNDATEIFEVQLRYGLTVVRHTDFDLPGKMPIRFERALRPGGWGADSFGVSGTDSYNSYLSSNDNIRIDINGDDGYSFALIRSPRWLPLLQFVKYVDQDMSGRFYEMRWHAGPGGHYELRRYDGRVSNYLPCGNSMILKCYLDGVRDPDGQKLDFVRDGQRRLEQLTSSDQQWLHLTHGPGGPITSITDSKGRTVRYGYNDKNELVSASYPSGEELRYGWDDEQHLLTFSAAPSAGAESRVLLRNEYQHGILTKMTLADGRAYTYSYDPADVVPARALMLRSADGRLFRMWMNGRDARIWEQRPGTSTATASR